ncbi:ABC transporter ATP-binding protein [Nocardia sp. NPDC003354]
MYELSGVTKHYTRGKATVHALDGVDLTIADGDRLVIQGPTGGGKSTLLQMLGALDRPSAGRIVLDGTDLAPLPEARLTRVRSESIGFVFQSFHLLPYRTVDENVMLAEVYRAKGSEGGRRTRRDRAREALDRVGLGHRFGFLPGRLSGGERQRVAIARALLGEPALLLCDEPTGNLDPQTSVGIMKLLDRINRTGTTVVMATHDQNIVDQMRKRVIELEKGRLVRDQARGVYGYQH